MNKFDRDLEILSAKLNRDTEKEAQKKLNVLKDKLIRLHEENVVKINHSVMELVCAKHLILKGYELDIERPVDGLVCDRYGVKGLGSGSSPLNTRLNWVGTGVDSVPTSSTATTTYRKLPDAGGFSSRKETALESSSARISRESSDDPL